MNYDYVNFYRNKIHVAENKTMRFQLFSRYRENLFFHGLTCGVSCYYYSPVITVRKLDNYWKKSYKIYLSSKNQFILYLKFLYKFSDGLMND